MFGIGTGVSADTTVDITEQGERVAQKYAAVDPSLKILATLHERQSTMTVGEISEQTGIEINEVKRHVEKLTKKHMIMVM